MTDTRSTAGAQRLAATRDDLLRLLGDVDERKVLDILALKPAIDEIERAARRSVGDGDILAEEDRPLTAAASTVLDVLAADDEKEETSPAR